jgi:hypothetical protein
MTCRLGALPATSSAQGKNPLPDGRLDPDALARRYGTPFASSAGTSEQRPSKPGDGQLARL